MVSEADKKTKESIDYILNDARNREGAKNILGFLFPNLHHILDTYYFTSTEDIGMRRLRHSISISEFSND